MLKILSNTKNEWETLATLDPLWAILSDNNKRFGNWNMDDFFATGEKEIAASVQCLKVKGILVHKMKRALDFGCGVGRLTRALAKYFPCVYGLDISSTMISQAKTLNAAYRNCHFKLNNEDYTLHFPNNYFDFIYSNNVLQHFPNTQTALKQISDFIRLLKPSGIAVFQFPSRLPFLDKLHPRRRLYHVLKYLGFNENVLYNKLHLYGFSMLCLSVPEIRTILLERNVKIIDIKDEGSIYTTYIIKKTDHS